MNRWVLLLGRTGTVLLAVTGALLLVSLLPSGSLGGSSEYVSPIPEEGFLPVSVQSLTPQQSIRMTVRTDSTIQLYLLEVDSSVMFEWIFNHTIPGSSQFNITNLENFLREYRPSIALNKTISNETFEYEYFPTAVTDVTIIVANPSQGQASVSFRSSTTAQLVPSARVLSLAWWTLGVGAILAFPWAFGLMRSRANTRQPIRK